MIVWFTGRGGSLPQQLFPDADVKLLRGQLVVSPFGTKRNKTECFGTIWYRTERKGMKGNRTARKGTKGIVLPNYVRGMYR